MTKLAHFALKAARQTKLLRTTISDMVTSILNDFRRGSGRCCDHDFRRLPQHDLWNIVPIKDFAQHEAPEYQMAHQTAHLGKVHFWVDGP